jgi:hypothetical protein
MSLTKFLNIPDVRARVKALRPKFPRKLSVPLKVESRSKRYMLVGTAFDYLLRFELQRRAPHAVSERWVAESAPEMISSGFPVQDLVRQAYSEHHMSPDKLAEQVRVLLENAKAAVAAHLRLKAPTAAQHGELAAHAIRLAKVDTVCRAGQLQPGFEEASSEDIHDLVDLLAIVPFDALLHDKLLLLNPNFKQTSRLVGGADTDLIAGDLLVDFKTTKAAEIQVGDLDQILGYLLLDRKQCSVDPTFPVINRVGLYYCRHGYLWSMEASTWSAHPEFFGIEQWFFQRADEVFGASKKADK